MFLLYCESSEDCVIPCGPKKGVGVLNVCEFTTKRAIYVLIVTLDSTHNEVKV